MNKVTPALFARAPTAEAMAATPIEEIQELIRLARTSPLHTRRSPPDTRVARCTTAKTIRSARRDGSTPAPPQVGLAPSKAKYLQGLSQMIIEKHAGVVPRSLEELEALPGVGHKTAGVVVSQGFGEPAFPVDTHIHRCAQRWGLTNGHSVEQTEADLMSLIPRDRWVSRRSSVIFQAQRVPALPLVGFTEDA